MFLLPFLKYLAPHKWRIVISLICMFGVGFFGSYSLFLFKPALDVLMGNVKLGQRIAESDTKILEHREKIDKLVSSKNRAERLSAKVKLLYYPLEEWGRRRIFGSSFFGEEELKNPTVLTSFTLELKDPQNLVSADLMRRFSPELRQQIQTYASNKPVSSGLRLLLVRDLNTIIESQLIFKELPIKGLLPDPKKDEENYDFMRDMIDGKPKQGNLVLFNRLLLQQAYKKELKEEPPFSLYRFAKEKPSQALRLIAAFIILTSLLNGCFEYGFRYNLSYALYSAVIAIKSAVFRQIMRQDMQYFSIHPVGFLMSRISSDVQALRTVMEMLAKTALLESINLIAVISCLLIISVPITAMVFVGVVPALLLLMYFAKVIKQVTRKSKRKSDVLSAVMNESLINARLVKAMNTEKLECDKFDEHNYRLFFYEMQRRVAKFAASPIMTLFGALGLSAILLMGGYIVKNKEMDPSMFLVYLGLLSRFYGPLKNISRVNVSWQTGNVSAERVCEMLALQPAIIDPTPDLPPVELKGVRDGISLQNISFAYKDKMVLKNVNFRIPIGKTTALVGRSGSGKSTLANLLLRLYDPNDGHILLDGTDLRHFRLKDLRALYGIVTQETMLFSDTVANNIAYGSADKADMDRVIEAAKAANAHDFIMSLDDGNAYKSPIGPGGSRLSGGQKQRIAIARAFYRNPHILILDEATSALDNESEAAVQEALGNLMKNRTVVVIAHRLTTIRDADNIGVLDNGLLVEQGTHEELMNLGGQYASLYRHGDFGA